MSINKLEPDALIIGKVGYGKSNLLQVIAIPNYALPPQDISIH